MLGRRIRRRFRVEKSAGTLIDLEGIDTMAAKFAQLAARGAVGRRRTSRMKRHSGGQLYTHGLSDVGYRVAGTDACMAATKIRVQLA